MDDLIRLAPLARLSIANSIALTAPDLDRGIARKVFGPPRATCAVVPPNEQIQSRDAQFETCGQILLGNPPALFL